MARTAAGKVLQSSYWPTILRSDATHNHGVRKPIMFAVLAIPLIAILTAVAGVVTPLGLYDDLMAYKEVVGSFEYVSDPSVYFDGTSPRKNLPFSRTCMFMANTGVCPFTDDSVVYSRNSSTISWDFPNGVHTDIPSILREVYSSGTKGVATTVSNFFDIEWRQLTMRTQEVLNNGTEYPVGIFRQLDSILLWDSYKAVEGLVVNGKEGGIGFRNHTIPTGLARGASWKEDLLFVEPVTACVDTNLTFDFTISSAISFNTSNFVDFRLTDRGGFVNLVHEYPYYDLSNPQKNPDVWGRAYKAAVINNFYTMLYLNVTSPSNETLGTKAFAYVNSELGKSFDLPAPTSLSFDSLGIDISIRYGDYLFDSLKPASDNYPNPWNITADDYFDYIRK